jgi:heme-degrading monooxygenase HmoA
MIVRIWRTELDPTRESEYREFEQQHSLPMFRRQPGFLGVLFLRAMSDTAAALTFWKSREDAIRLVKSSSYRETVVRLEQTGLLRGDQTVDISEVAGAHIEDALPEVLTHLGSLNRRGSRGRSNS